MHAKIPILFLLMKRIQKTIYYFGIKFVVSTDKSFHPEIKHKKNKFNSVGGNRQRSITLRFGIKDTISEMWFICSMNPNNQNNNEIIFNRFLIRLPVSIKCKTT